MTEYDDYVVEYDSDEKQTEDISSRQASRRLNTIPRRSGRRKPHTLNNYTIMDIATATGLTIRTVYRRINTYGKHPKEMTLGELVDFINRYKKKKDIE
jgi:hypothetical protein